MSTSQGVALLYCEALSLGIAQLVQVLQYFIAITVFLVRY